MDNSYIGLFKFNMAQAQVLHTNRHTVLQWTSQLLFCRASCSSARQVWAPTGSLKLCVAYGMLQVTEGVIKGEKKKKTIQLLLIQKTRLTEEWRKLPLTFIIRTPPDWSFFRISGKKLIMLLGNTAAQMLSIALTGKLQYRDKDFLLWKDTFIEDSIH